MVLSRKKSPWSCESAAARTRVRASVCRPVEASNCLWGSAAAVGADSLTTSCCCTRGGRTANGALVCSS
eukprot:3451574-Prymnesium_polylepis.1